MIGYKPVGLWECGCTAPDFTTPAKFLKIIDEAKKNAKNSKIPVCYYIGYSNTNTKGGYKSLSSLNKDYTDLT